MKILFPASAIFPLKPDEFFTEEFKEAVDNGHTCHLFDCDQFLKSGELISSRSLETKDTNNPEPIIYRGFMFKSKQYEAFYRALLSIGYSLINDELQYTRCHHSFECQDIFGIDTPKILYFPNLTKELFERIFTAEVLEAKLKLMRQNFASEHFILKDSVKSEKDIPDLFKISLNITGEELRSKILAFIDARSTCYNDGIVFREFVDLKENENGQINEWRTFYLNGKNVCSYQNSNWKNADKPDMDWMQNFAKRIQSNFFTLDVAQKKDGSWMIMETGDGQVSDINVAPEEAKIYMKSLYQGIKEIMSSNEYVPQNNL